MKKVVFIALVMLCPAVLLAQKATIDPFPNAKDERVNRIDLTQPNPIFIVDNVIVSNVLLHSFDPNDIESIQVYKSPSSQIQQYDDLVKNGLINIVMKKPQNLEKLSISEAKKRLNLTSESKFFLNGIEVHNPSILIAEDLLKKARILQPDNKLNHSRVPAISIETN